jgi:hypothetical protein
MRWGSIAPPRRNASAVVAEITNTVLNRDSAVVMSSAIPMPT